MKLLFCGLGGRELVFPEPFGHWGTFLVGQLYCECGAHLLFFPIFPSLPTYMGTSTHSTGGSPWGVYFVPQGVSNRLMCTPRALDTDALTTWLSLSPAIRSICA